MKPLSTTDLKGRRVAALVSGGLDSTTIIHWLTGHGVQVVAITADLGQPDEKDMDDIATRMRAAGAVDAVIVDGRELLAEYMLLGVVQGQAAHEGGYLNTTGIARMATVKIAMPEIDRRNLDIVVHGSTGRGNDQVRFELATVTLDPRKRVYAPWRDQAFIDELGGRKQMIKYCLERQLRITATDEKPYSTDANFCGLTHEAGRLESIAEKPDYVEFVMGASPKNAPDKEEVVTIGFQGGRPVVINGRRMSTLDAFLWLNTIGGRNGVGIGLDVVENRRVGIKSRGVYEAPGATVLYRAYGKMLELVMDRQRRKFFDIVSRQLADAIYEGEWFTPLAYDLLAVSESVARHVTGSVSFGLYKGAMRFLSASDVEHSLYDPDTASMEKIGSFNHTDSQGYLNIANVRARALSTAGQVRQ